MSSVGFFIITILIVLKYLGAFDSETPVVDTAPPEIPWRSTETDPILPEKPVRLTYGTTAEEDDDDAESGSSSSSEDLYDAKLCVICYDDQRNCFFVPCGHCATCYDCAQRYKVGKFPLQNIYIKKKLSLTKHFSGLWRKITRCVQYVEDSFTK